MSNDHISLFQLHERSGVEPRTLRSWIQHGLVPGPDNRGRNAGYPVAALARAKAVRYLRDLGRSLDEIRRELTLASEEQIKSYAEKAGRLADPSPGGAIAAAGGSTAADFLQGLREKGVYGASAPETSADTPRSALPQITTHPPTRLRRVVQRLEQAAGGRVGQRRMRGEKRTHFQITPDIELIVRGELTDDESRQFEDFSEVLRNTLAGGDHND